jgi:hypothetical protein
MSKSYHYHWPLRLCFRGSVLGEERVVGIFAVHTENGALPRLAVDISTFPRNQKTSKKETEANWTQFDTME